MWNKKQIRSYNKKRNRIYYKDKKIEKLPVNKIKEKIGSVIDNNISNLFSGKLEASFTLGWVLWDDKEGGGRKKLLKDGNHARRYVKRINTLSNYMPSDKREPLPGAKHFMHSSSITWVKSNAQVDLEKDNPKENLFFKVEKILLNSDEVDFSHYVQCELTHKTDFIDETLTNFSYYSPQLSSSLFRKIKPRGEAKEKLKYRGNYTLKDIPDILEHYNIVGPTMIKECSDKEITVKCLDYLSRKDLKTSIHQKSPTERDFEELSKEFRQTTSTPRRNWSKNVKKEGKILLEKVDDVLEVVYDMFGFEFIPVIHKRDLNKEDQTVNWDSYPIDVVRDFDPKTNEYSKTKENMEKILNFDSEYGLKNKVRATGSSLGGFHIITPLFFEEKNIPPTSNSRWETYNRRRTDPEEWLASLKETIKTYSLIKSCKLDMDVGVNPYNPGEKFYFDAILDTSPIAINTGYKALGSLNEKRRWGVDTPIAQIPDTGRNYKKITSKEYVHQNIEHFREPEFSDKTRERNYRAIRDILEENNGLKINALYEKYKNKWTPPYSIYNFIDRRILN